MSGTGVIRSVTGVVLVHAALASLALAQAPGTQPATEVAASTPAPSPCPPEWLGLLGIYGTGSGVVMILERDGALEAGTQGGHFYALEQLGPDRFRFPNVGRNAARNVAFNRDASGKAVSLRLDESLVPRDTASDGVVPRVALRRTAEELAREAQQASPPTEPPSPLPSDLVDVTTLDPSVRVSLRYAGRDNVLSAPVLKASRALLQRPAAEALVRAHRALGRQGYGLVILDAYHPWWVTKAVWDGSPAEIRSFLADPLDGSGYNRGTTVDARLYHRSDGRVVDMPSVYGESSPRAYTDFPGGTSEQRWHRDLMLEAMEGEDFQSLRSQWWRYDFPAGRKYPILNVPLEEAGAAPGSTPGH